MDHVATVRVPDNRILKNKCVTESILNEKENETICDLLFRYGGQLKSGYEKKSLEILYERKNVTS